MSLGIAVEKVCEIITHLRAYDSGIVTENPEVRLNEPDDVIEEGELEARLEEPHTDPMHDELTGVIDALNLEFSETLTFVRDRICCIEDRYEQAVMEGVDRYLQKYGERLGIPHG